MCSKPMHNPRDPVIVALWKMQKAIASGDGAPVHERSLDEFAYEAGISIKSALSELRSKTEHYIMALTWMRFVLSLHGVRYELATPYDFPPAVRRMLGDSILMLRTVAAEGKSKLPRHIRMAFAIRNDGVIITSNEPKQPRVNPWEYIGEND